MILPVCPRGRLFRVLITCDDDNEGSRKVIRANGGESRRERCRIPAGPAM